MDHKSYYCKIEKSQCFVFFLIPVDIHFIYTVGKQLFSNSETTMLRHFFLFLPPEYDCYFTNDINLISKHNKFKKNIY